MNTTISVALGQPRGRNCDSGECTPTTPIRSLTKRNPVFATPLLTLTPARPIFVYTTDKANKLVVARAKPVFQ